MALKPKGERESKDFAEQMMIYPVYLDFCYRRQEKDTLTHNTFIQVLILACKAVGWEVKKVKKEVGMSLSGIVVKPHVYSKEAQPEDALSFAQLREEQAQVWGEAEAREEAQQERRLN